MSTSAQKRAVPRLIIFDLDGVITSEEAFWDCGGLMLHELLSSPLYWGLSADGVYHPVMTAAASRQVSRMVYPESLLFRLKARGLYTTWENSYVMAVVYLVALLTRHPNPASLFPFQPASREWLAALRSEVATHHLAQRWDLASLHQQWSQHSPVALPMFGGTIGWELLNRCDAYASAVLGLPVEDSFSPQGPFWRLCQDLLQEWLLGDRRYFEVYGRHPAQRGSPAASFLRSHSCPQQGCVKRWLRWCGVAIR